MRTVPTLASILGATLFAGSAFAGFSTYGTGCPDSSTAVPTFNMTGQAVPGGLVNVAFDSGVPGSLMFIMVGLTQASLPMGYGCTLNVAPLLVPVGPLPTDANGDLIFPTVLPDTLPAPFTFTFQAFVQDGGVTAGFGNSNGVQMDLTPLPPATGLVINEVDYDQPGTDATEFVEIYNPTANAISTAGLSLVLVNGSNNTTYLAFDLSAAGSIPAGGYLVVADTAVTVDPGAIVLNFATATNSIQNGAPDGIALVDTISGSLIDVLSYEGAMTAATVTGVAGTVSLVEGTASAVTDTGVLGSNSRFPNGVDYNDASIDWIFSSTPTPGTANVP